MLRSLRFEFSGGLCVNNFFSIFCTLSPLSRVLSAKELIQLGGDALASLHQGVEICRF